LDENKPSGPENTEKAFKDRIAVLKIAYHNLAVEQEFLK
jgi:hypothetical protein